MVKEREAQAWKDVLPCMMSEEEDTGPNTFERHHPLWKSQKLNRFLGKLDTLFKKKSKKTTLAHERSYVEELGVPAPQYAKLQMMAEKENAEPAIEMPGEQKLPEEASDDDADVSSGPEQQ